MENFEIKNTALYHTIQSTIKEMLKENIDDVLDSVMPIFEPFIRERLNQYEEYRKLQVTATAPITLVNNEAKVYLYNEKYAENHGGNAQYILNINDIIEIKPNFHLKGLTVKYYSGLILDDKGCKLPEETTVDYIKIL